MYIVANQTTPYDSFSSEMTILRGNVSNVGKYLSVMCLYVLCGVVPTIIIIIRAPISFMEVEVNKVYVCKSSVAT